MLYILDVLSVMSPVVIVGRWGGFNLVSIMLGGYIIILYVHLFITTIISQVVSLQGNSSVLPIMNICVVCFGVFILIGNTCVMSAGFFPHSKIISENAPCVLLLFLSILKSGKGGKK